MTRARRRSPAARRLGALLAAAGLLVGLAGTGAAAVPVQDAPAAVPQLVVAGQDLEVAADGPYSVALDIAGAPAGSDVVVQIHDRIEDAADLAASSTDQPGDRLATFDPIDLADGADPQTTLFTIHLYDPPADRPSDVPANWVLPLDEPGVYPVKVRLRGPDGEDLTAITTYLVRRPAATDPVVAPARVALLPTVHQAPPPVDEAVDDPDDVDGEPVDPAYRDALEDLLEAFEARPELPASFVVTPDTAARLDADPDALDTLDALRAELVRPGRELTGAPYVDLDPATLVGAGLGDEVIRQHDLGRRALAAALEQPDDRIGSTTWVLDRSVDAAAVDELAALGITHLVLPAEAVPSAPVTRLPLPGGGGTVDALTLAPDDLASGSPVDPVLAGYQLLGRLAATASINPAGTAVAVRIDPEAVDPVELATVLDGLAQPGTYVRATTLTEAFADTPLATTAVALAPADRGGLGSYPGLVNRTHQQLSSYASMVPDQPERVAAFEVPLARAASSDLELADRRRRVGREGEALERRLSSVSIPARDRVTLGARNAQFPLPVTSTLTGPVDVVITLEASDRLSFPQDRIEATLTDERTVVQVPVRTRATGDTPLRITVRSPDGGQVLAQSQYTVRSTAVSGMGLLLTAGAAGFLALWWGRHWWRSRRAGPPPAARHGRQGSPPPDPDGDLDDLFVTDPTDPADVTSVTGARSKVD